MNPFEAGPTRKYRLMVAKLMLACAAIALIPACGRNPKNDPPSVLFFTPSATANIPLVLIIYVDWDRALDPTTVPGSMTITDNLGGSPGGTILYNAVLNQISLTPGTLVAGRTYTVAILGTIKSSNGVQFGGAAFQFTAANPGSAVQPGFTGVSGAVPTPLTAQSVDLTWTAAVDGSEAVVYDVYASTVSGGEDFSLLPLKTETVSTTGTTIVGLTTGVPYFFMVRARGSVSNNIDFNTTERSATPN